MREFYWLVGRHSKPDLADKRLLYVAIIKPIRTYGIHSCGAVPENPTLKIFNVVEISSFVQLRQHTGLIGERHHTSRSEDIIIRSGRNPRGLSCKHSNATAKQLLDDNSQDIRRLKRYEPYDLV